MTPRGTACRNGDGTSLDFETGQGRFERAGLDRPDGGAIDGSGELDTNGGGDPRGADGTTKTGLGASLPMTGDGHTSRIEVEGSTRDDVILS